MLRRPHSRPPNENHRLRHKRLHSGWNYLKTEVAVEVVTAAGAAERWRECQQGSERTMRAVLPSPNKRLIRASAVVERLEKPVRSRSCISLHYHHQRTESNLTPTRTMLLRCLTLMVVVEQSCDGGDDDVQDETTKMRTRMTKTVEVAAEAVVVAAVLVHDDVRDDDANGRERAASASSTDCHIPMATS